VDSDTLEDQTVTVRQRDNMEQDRVPIDQLRQEISTRMEQWEAPA